MIVIRLNLLLGIANLAVALWLIWLGVPVFPWLLGAAAAFNLAIWRAFSR
jgi:hypothetical protein